MSNVYAFILVPTLTHVFDFLSFFQFLVFYLPKIPDYLMNLPCNLGMGRREERDLSSKGGS